MQVGALFENTVANLIAALVILIAGAALGWFGRKYIERRPIRQILGLNERYGSYTVLATPLFIIPGTRKTSTTAGVPMTPIGPALAFKHISNVLTKAYSEKLDSKLYFSTEFPPELYSKNLFLIGFPLANQITKEVMSDTDLPVVFSDHKLISRDTGKVLYEAVVDKGEVKHDYGCLIRIPNPYHSKSVVFIMAGCQTYGVRAAAEFLSSENFLTLVHAQFPRLLMVIFRKLPFLMLSRWRNQYYQIIISVTVKENFVSEQEVVAYHSLKPNSVTRNVPNTNTSSASTSR